MFRPIRIRGSARNRSEEPEDRSYYDLRTAHATAATPPMKMGTGRSSWRHFRGGLQYDDDDEVWQQR